MRRMLLVTLGAMTLAAVPADAQVAWDAPLFLSPQTPVGLGIYLVDPGPSDGIGVLATWRGGGPGFRIGLAEDGRDDLSVYGGVDFTARLVTASTEFPLHVNWVVGAGFGAGDDLALSFPLGLSLGRGFNAETVLFSPYIAPRLVLDAFFGGNGDEDDSDDLDLGFALDLGLDLSFDPGWAVRFGASLGDRDAIGIGLSFNVL